MRFERFCAEYSNLLTSKLRSSCSKLIQKEDRPYYGNYLVREGRRIICLNFNKQLVVTKANQNQGMDKLRKSSEELF